MFYIVIVEIIFCAILISIINNIIRRKKKVLFEVFEDDCESLDKCKIFSEYIVFVLMKDCSMNFEFNYRLFFFFAVKEFIIFNIDAFLEKLVW